MRSLLFKKLVSSMQRKDLSRTQRVGIVAGTLAATVILAVSQLATGGLFTSHEEAIIASTENPQVATHKPSPTTHNNKERTPATSMAKKQPKKVAKTKIATPSSEIELPIPNPYPDGYPMVVFGDSTMSLAPTKKQAENPLSKCKHYEGAWPQRVSAKLGLPMADLSCAGARSGLYWKLNAKKYVGPTTRLVLLSYGSNDLHVQNQLISDNAFPGTGPYLPHAEQSAVEQDLVDVLQDIRALAPKAMIVTVGYLPLVEGVGCKNLPNMTPLEMARVENLRRGADESLSNATTRAADYSTAVMRDRGLEVASSGVFNVPFRDVTGHTLCAADPERFILNHEEVGARYHYTVPGLQYVTQAVVERYQSEVSLWEMQSRKL
ncbi:hypothetical protein LC603019_00837 [Lawsonella clevelandensis]|uniref:SGNH hydrolase-type esterase domain-containing protein n=3 Tax=Lawsonella clevelandensis TaxID=1528099 RepID=A0A5E3ZX54_9ACTN|nr:hypothetical protein LC603019_00837 [Lawsonella clevelandensis]